MSSRDFEYRKITRGDRAPSQWAAYPGGGSRENLQRGQLLNRFRPHPSVAGTSETFFRKTHYDRGMRATPIRAAVLYSISGLPPFLELSEIEGRDVIHSQTSRPPSFSPPSSGGRVPSPCADASGPGRVSINDRKSVRAVPDRDRRWMRENTTRSCLLKNHAHDNSLIRAEGGPAQPSGKSNRSRCSDPAKVSLQK